MSVHGCRRKLTISENGDEMDHYIEEQLDNKKKPEPEA